MRNKAYAERYPKFIPIKAQKQIRIGEREINILKDLARYRYLTTDQIFQLHFPKGSISYCHERLKYLFHAPLRLVNRFSSPVEWGKGAAQLIYTLTKRGADLLRSRGIDTNYTFQKAYKLRNNKPAYKAHEIAINQFRISIEKGVKKYGWEIEEWITDVEFKNPQLIPKMRVDDPESSKYIPVVPDGFFCIHSPQTGKRAIFFLEVERGKIAKKRLRIKKIRGFDFFRLKWRMIDEFRKYKDLQITFRVLIVVDGGTKLTLNLMKDCGEKEFIKGSEKERLAKGRNYYFTELSKVTPETVLTDLIWLIPFQSTTSDKRFSLFDQTF